MAVLNESAEQINAEVVSKFAVVAANLEESVGMRLCLE
jgi:hypothetical protein